jgi:N-acyl homoserine lactone hydrolase
MTTTRPTPHTMPLALIAAALAGCAVSTHPVQDAGLGVVRSSLALEALMDEPGPVEVESIRAARWSVPRSGLLNLDDPAARAAGLTDGPEPIEIYFHALRHPSRGLFIVDSGVERALARDADDAAVGSLTRYLSGLDEMQVDVDLASWLEQSGQPLAGVLLTHLHLDHVLGLPDVPRGTPLYTGPGETEPSSFLNVFTQSITDRVLRGHVALFEWQFEPDPSGRFAGVLDIFGDGSVWALHVPGHTPGSTAYLARTPNGPVVFTGDACHTSFGWEHGVEPGTFSLDQPESEASLTQLTALARRHPRLDVRLGHQKLTAGAAALAREEQGGEANHH